MIQKTWRHSFLVRLGFFISASVTALTLSSVQAATCVNPPVGLVSWWRAEGDPNDQNGLNPAVAGGALAYSTGQVGQAFSFDGKTSYVRVPASSTLDVGKNGRLTIEGWIQPSAAGTMPIVDWSPAGAYAVHIWVDSNQALYANLVDTSGASHPIQSPNGQIATGVFQHIALTYDSSSGIAILYWNGTLVGQTTLGTFVPLTSTDLYIGNRTTGAPYGPDFFSGLIDDLSLYSQVLSAAEIQAIYAAGGAGKCTTPPGCTVPAANLTGWWQGEGDASDASGNNNTGTLVNGVGFAPGKVGQAFSFNGVNQIVQIPDNPLLDASNALTMEGWVYLSAFPSQVVSIVAKESQPSSIEYQITLVNSSGHWAFQPLITVPSGWAYFPGSTSLQTQTWYHVAVTYDGSALKLFVNGILDGSTPATGAIVVGPQPLTIGGQTSGWFFNGRVDEFSLYNRALSTAEIQSIYSSGSNGKCTTPVAPAITTQPTNIVAFVGQSATFAVGASGSQPLSYQWSLDGNAISSATNAMLVLTNLQLAQAGTYEVQVTNSVGAITSAPVTLTVNTPPSCSAPPLNLVGWWRGDGDAIDATGNKNDGTLLNNASFAPGKVGQAFSFNGVNQIVQIPDNPLLNPSNALTMEGWVYVSGFQGPVVSIVAKENQPASIEYQITLVNSSGHWAFQPLITVPSGWAYFPSATAVQAQTWYHLAVTYDGASLKLYVNGVLDGSTPASGPIVTGPQPLAIGGQASGWYFNGRVDEFSLYNRALTAAEIQSVYYSDTAGKCTGPTAPAIFKQPSSQTLIIGRTATFQVLAGGTQPLSYQWSLSGSPIAGATASSLVITNVQSDQAGPYTVQITNPVGSVVSSNAVLTVNPPPPCVTAPAGLVSWWPAEGDAGDVAAANSGVLVNGAGFAPGYVGQAFSFTGANQVVQIADAPALNPTNALTIEGWVLVSGYPGVDASIIVGKDNVNFGRQYELDVYRSGNGLVFMPNIGVPAGFINFQGSQTIQTNTWTHVAMTYDGTSLQLYVNGVLDTSKAVTGPITTGPAPLTIGGLSGGTWFFNGLVDELSLYNRALSAAEIQSIFAADAAGKCPVMVAPVISTQPASQTVTVGQNATLSVLAGGTRPLSYQWTVGGQPLPGATNSTLLLTNVQRSQAGTYAVTVTNTVGTATSSNALLTVNFPPAKVQVASAPVGADGSVTVPILLIANGNENALGFSLNFPPALLSCSGAVLGSDATGANLFLNTNSIASGQLGVAVSLSAGATFAAGTQQVLQVSFSAAVLTNPALATLSFGDQPTRRELSDPQPVALAANFIGSTLAIPASEFEGDVSPRPAGDRAVSITDWVLLGRYAARLDYPTNAAEYQRADCAPRSTLGDGAITIADWVQAGRYAVGLDPATRAGGPTNDLGGNVVSAGTGGKVESGGLPKQKGQSPRQVKFANTYLAPGQSGTVSVLLEAQGNENAVGFSVAFDPTVLTYTSASLGANAAGATINVNASQAGAGKVAFVLALPIGTSFSAGTKEILQVNLSPVATALGDYSVAFTDQPVVRQVVDPTATTLSTEFINGTVLVNPLPTLNIANSHQTITLSWPLWATNFTLQQAEGALLQSSSWTNVPVSFGITNSEAVVTLPVDGTTKFYRLQK